MVNDKDMAIHKTIIDHILREREKLGLPSPVPSTELGLAARDTAFWLASEEEYPGDKTFDYLMARLAEKPGNANAILFPRLAYGRHIWPADAEPSKIAKDLIKYVSFSEVINSPALDYLGMSSCFGDYDQSGNSVETSGGQPHSFGYALVVAYASDGNSAIVDRINERREKAGVFPLNISVPLRDMARKFITLPSADEASDSLYDEAQDYGYATEGWRVRLGYSGSYAKAPSSSETSINEPEMADIIATQLVREWPILLRPDWQDIGIATSAKNHPDLGGLNFQAEVVTGWRIPLDAERPDHFPPEIDQEGNPSPPVDANTRGGQDALDALLGPVYREEQVKPKRRRGWWPFRS